MPWTAEKQRAVRDARRAAGICVRCKTPSGGRATCDACRAEHTAFTAHMRKERRDAGLCVDCGEPVTKFVNCVLCRQVRAEKARQA